MAALGLIAAAIAIWWRNHDILRDLYDASSIIVAVGKLEAGLRPYVDFRSTMQSATYVLNWLTEQVFGAHYLGLVKGGLLLTLAGGATLAWMWRRSFGALGAVLLAGCVMISGLSQHVFIFYNPLGLLCLAIVVAGLATDPRLWPLRSAESWLVCTALVVGGANKINFHALTLSLAGLLILRGWLAGEQRFPSAMASGAVLIVFGVAAPLALELAWTGASLRGWAYNLLELPSERVGFVLDVFGRDIYLKPAYDVHHSVIFKPLTTAGLILVVVTTVAVWRRAVAPLPSHARRLACGLVLAGTSIAVMLGGILLTITNVEIITLTSLGFPIGAAGIWAAFRPARGRHPDGLGRILIPAASLLWTVVGGYAAWQGSRVIFGDEPPRRDDYVRLTHPSPTLAYLHGVRLEPGWHDSLLATVKELERINLRDPGLSSVLFGPAFEWMERAHPAAILRGMPVWFHHGTSLSSGDGPWLEESLAAKGVDRVVLNPHWESWPGSFWLHLATHFRHVELGRFARVYERKQASTTTQPVAANLLLHPWSFREHTGSNVHWNATTAPSDAALFESPWGWIAGRIGNMEWIWREGSYLAQGNAVALLTVVGEAPVNVTFRIVCREGRNAVILFEQTIALAADRPEIRVPFHVSPGGNPLTLSITVPTGDQNRVLCGWRDLRIGHTGPALNLPPATLLKLQPASPALVPPTATALWLPFADPATADGWYATPMELWQPVPEGTQQASVALEVTRRLDGNGHPTLLTLAWYKSGRIEFLRQAIVNPETPETVELSADLPESGGWVGILALAADPTASPNTRIRPPTWRW